MKNKHTLLFAIAILVLSGGCGSYRDITVSDVSNFSFTSTDDGKFKISLDAQVNNPALSKVTMKSAKLNVQYNKSPFATLTLQRPIVIPRGASAQTLEMELQLRNLMLMIMGFKDLSADNFTIGGSADVVALLTKKTIYIKSQSLQEFERQYGNIFSPFLKGQD
jgi:hypothetical protein